MVTRRGELFGWLVVITSLSMIGCGNSPGRMLGDPSAGQSLPSASDLDGEWFISADAAGTFLFGCLDINGGRPVSFFDACGTQDGLVTSKPIVFDDTGPIIEFTAFDSTSVAVFAVTVFATPRHSDFFDILLVADNAIESVSLDGQMERR